MKRALSCFLLAAAGLCAQSTAKLDTDLITASRHVSAASYPLIASDILLLATRDARPSRQSVLDFANVLGEIMAGFSLDETPKVEKIKPVTQAIRDVLQSSGVSSYRFHKAIGRFRDALIALGPTEEQATKAAGRLLIVDYKVNALK